MIHLACILGYGDSLITLSLLERAGPPASRIRVLGTAVTSETAAVMQHPHPIAEVLFAGVPAFYVIRERGLRAALRDILQFRRWVTARLSPADTLVLEKRDPRTRLLVPRGTCTIIEIPRVHNAYVDREAALRPIIGEQRWLPCVRPNGVARRVLINPAARVSSKALSMEVIEASLQVAASVGTEVCLIDVDGRYEALSSRVHCYLKTPSLRNAVAAMRESDRYIGPDSFFIHLAYYYQIPFLAFFRRKSTTYFMPPGTMEQGNYTFFQDGVDQAHLRGKLRLLLSPS